METQYKIINAEHIVEPPNPNRFDLEENALKDLAQSIKEVGLLQPITVRVLGDKFEVVAGHRRFRACLLAGVINVPCTVRTLSEDAAEQVKAHENLYRSDLSPLEEPHFLARLIQKRVALIPETAKRLSRSEEWVKSRLEILEYPEYFWPAIENGDLQLGVAKHLAKITDEVYRKMYFESAVNNGMKVWQAETALRQFEAGLLTPSSIIMPDPAAVNPRATSSYKTICEKCRQVGETPNIKTVWIHLECPAEPAQPHTEAP